MATGAVIGAVAAVAIIVAAIVAVLATGGDDDTTTATDGAVALAAGVPGAGASIGEQLDVEPTGEPLPPYAPVEVDPAVGLPAPVIVGQAFDGTELTLGAASDGPTMIVFLAHWCPHCNDEVPVLNELRDAGSFPAELNVVGVATGSRPDAPNWPPSEWAVEKDWTWPMLVDDELGTAMGYFGGTSYPFAVIVGADGTVLARKAGGGPAAETLAWVESALG